MIEITKDRTFHLMTEKTSYIFSIHNSGYAEHIYYGRRLSNIDFSIDAIKEKHFVSPCFSVYTDREERNYSLNDTLLEFSTEGRGDFRTPSIALSYGANGLRTLSFKFVGYRLSRGIKRFASVHMPQAITTEDDADTLELCYRDSNAKVALYQYYTTFNSSDVITRRQTLVNESGEKIVVRSLASAQLDVRAENAYLITFPGDWAKERHAERKQITQGTLLSESRGLESSADSNPAFIIQSEKDTFLLNLVYSGAHRASVSKTSQNLVHIVWGINPDMLSWPLEASESFESPEAVMIYSTSGLDGVRDISHKFINRHILRGTWRDKLRPLMFNTWEGSYFSIDEHKVDQIANKAKDCGFEGIVVDDGWFGARNNDRTSLGDWYADTMKFPSGLAELGLKIHQRGLLFGLWLEMESVSEKSNLFKKHPEWIIGRKISENAEGRNQQLLDLTNPEVQSWIIDTVTQMVEIGHIDYIKWDMNRRYSDLFSHSEIKDYGMYAHKYILSLYYILRTLTMHFPNLYIEGCASGGARFDLGMLSYCASIWTSDCSDPIERLKITEGTAMVYPLSVMGVSVSPSPNAHTIRAVDLDTRFETALFGVLNYSVDFSSIQRETLNAYKNQTEFYKHYRTLLQFGIFRVQEDNNRVIWTAVSPDRSTILVLYLQKEVRINTTAEKLYIESAEEEFNYRFYPRERDIPTFMNGRKIEEEPEYYTVSGRALKWAGISLSEQYSGNGYNEGVRVLGDFTSRLYIIKRI